MYLMLQQENPDDYVIATGETHALEDFVATATCVGLDWREHTVINQSLDGSTEITVNLGNPAKAQNQLKWETKSKMHDVVRRMVKSQLGD
jgi:GDPmannose 4,6-dehydratase